MPFKDKTKRKQYVDNYNKKYYLSNKEVIKNRAAAFKKKSVIRNSEFVKEYLSKHACLDCGEKDIRVLEFDHTKDDKYNDVSVLVWRACSIKTIEKEINKCEVVCANCHRKRTWQRKNNIIC